MNLENKNFFITPSSILPQEFFEKLIEEESFFVEKIISEGHATPAGKWYDQDTTEFVMLIKGRAILEFEEGEKKEMVPGDYVIIPKNKKHRVSWTDPRQKTFWLAIHYK